MVPTFRKDAKDGAPRSLPIQKTNLGCRIWLPMCGFACSFILRVRTWRERDRNDLCDVGTIAAVAMIDAAVRLEGTPDAAAVIHHYLGILPVTAEFKTGPSIVVWGDAERPTQVEAIARCLKPRAESRGNRGTSKTGLSGPLRPLSSFPRFCSTDLRPPPRNGQRSLPCSRRLRSLSRTFLSRRNFRRLRPARAAASASQRSDRRGWRST